MTNSMTSSMTFEKIVKTEVKKLDADDVCLLYKLCNYEEYMLQLENLETDDDEKVEFASNFFATIILKEPYKCEKAFLPIAESMTASYDSIREIGLRKKDEKSLPLIAVLLSNKFANKISDDLFKKLIDIGLSLEGGRDYGKKTAKISTEHAEEFKNAFTDKKISSYGSCLDLRYHILRNSRFERFSFALIHDFFEDKAEQMNFINNLIMHIVESIRDISPQILKHFGIENLMRNFTYRDTLDALEEAGNYLKEKYSWDVYNEIERDIKLLRKIDIVKTFKECMAVIRSE